ncbi:hypothetical protein [Nonomuraea sp. NPDC052634]|uniref:hypothetical protein n=1 Tax=Nonomuraea sp. NPDC052634 TaxID=3155813 RepID=UPI003436C778
MTDPLESRLRAALGRAATRAPQAPPRFSAELVARSRRRRMRKNAVLAGVCVAAIAAPVTMLIAGGGDPGYVAAVVASTPAPPSEPAPIGERLTIENPSERRPISFWYARTANGDTVLCHQRLSRTGASVESCGDRPVDGEQATEQGDTRTFPPPATGEVLHFGSAGAEVARVTAVLKEGERVTGTLATPRGAPQAVWTVTVPADEPVTAIEFAGRDGKTIKRIAPRPLTVPEATAKPVGDTVRMPAKLEAGLYETPGRTLIWKLGGQAVGLHHLDGARTPLGMGGDRRNAELREHGKRWFGITGEETARVALVFADGTSVSAATRPDPWKLGGLRMFAGTQERTGDLYAEGFTIVGYGEDGAELWREKHDPAR